MREQWEFWVSGTPQSIHYSDRMISNEDPKLMDVGDDYMGMTERDYFRVVIGEAYETVLKERDRYRDALEYIVSPVANSDINAVNYKHIIEYVTKTLENK